MYGDRPIQLQKRISLSERYLWNPRNFNKSQDIYNFTTITQQQKKDFLYKYIYATHRVRSMNSEGFFMSMKDHIKVAIFMKNANEYVLRNPRISKVFVRKFYHDRASKNFLKHLQLQKHLLYSKENVYYASTGYDRRNFNSTVPTVTTALTDAKKNLMLKT